MSDPRRVQVSTVQATGQAQLQPRRSAVVVAQPSAVLVPSSHASTSSTLEPQRSRSSEGHRRSITSVVSKAEAATVVSALVSPVLPRLQSTLVDDSQRRSSLTSPLMTTISGTTTLQNSTDMRKRGPTAAIINQHIAEHSSTNTAATQPSPQIRASIPPVIRSPVLAHQPNPTTQQFRNSTTALGTKRWSLISSPGTSPCMQPSLPPTVVASSLHQANGVTSQATPQRSPTLVVRRSVVMQSSAAALAHTPGGTPGGSPHMALLISSPKSATLTPPLQKLTPTLPRAQASSATSAATVERHKAVSSQQVFSSASPAEEDDLNFELPPPVVGLDEDQQGDAASGARWSTVKSEDGSDDGDVDIQAGDPAQDKSLVLSPCGTRYVKAAKAFYLDRSYSIWFQTNQQAKKRPKSEQQYEEGLQSIGTFNTIQGFWQYWNAIDLKKLPNFCTLSVFKHPIKPMWEDPHNTNGGQWVIRCGDRCQTPDFFTKLALSLIGNYFDCHEDLCGVVLSMKPKFNSLSLWNCQVEPDLVGQVEDELKQLLEVEDPDGKFIIEYKDHSGTMVTNAIKRREVPELDTISDSAPRLAAKPSLLTQGPISLAPSWRTVRPAVSVAATAVTTSATAVASSTASAVAIAPASSGEVGSRTVSVIKTESGSSSSTLKATAAPFTYSGNAGYTSGYPSTVTGEFQYQQGAATNGAQYQNGNQYGAYYGGDYTYYGSGEYASYPAAGAYYTSGQNTSNEWG